jgi:hypothetical protein
MGSASNVLNANAAAAPKSLALRDEAPRGGTSTPVPRMSDLSRQERTGGQSQRLVGDSSSRGEGLKRRRDTRSGASTTQRPGRAVPGGVRIDFPLTDQLLADMGGLGSRERQSRAFRPCARRFPPSSALPVCPQIGPQELFSTSGDGTARAIGTRTALDPVPSAAARGPYNRRAPALTSGRGRP